MGKQISEERKKLYNAGLVMMIVGGCLFALPFLTIPIVIIAGLIHGDPGGFNHSWSRLRLSRRLSGLV